jgi:hypothetical protein
MKTDISAPASCGSCGVTECPLNSEDAFADVSPSAQAWLLDRHGMEFEQHLNDSTAVEPLVFTPWRSRLFTSTTYAWNSPRAGRWISVPLLTVQRAQAVRRLASAGGVLQRVMEDFDRKFAAVYAARLPYHVNQLAVWQNFAPFLQADKTLGGRRYEILLWRAPRHVMHEELAIARDHYPECKTLGDFRSSAVLVEAEHAALEGARRIVTPHTKLARLFPEKTVLLRWNWPKAQEKRTAGKNIAFLGPTLGRKGAFVARAALKKLGVPFTVIGRDFEENGRFWRGLPAQERAMDADWLREVGLLLAPAIAAFEPRRILLALARGIPVITTDACGLSPTENLHLVDPYDAEALAAKVAELLPC